MKTFRMYAWMFAKMMMGYITGFSIGWLLGNRDPHITACVTATWVVAAEVVRLQQMVSSKTTEGK